MKASCPACSSGYPIPDDKIGPKGLPVRCRRCGAVFRVFNDGRDTRIQSPPTEPEEAWLSREKQAEKQKTKKPMAKKKPKGKPSAREARVKKKVVKSTRLEDKPPAKTAKKSLKKVRKLSPALDPDAPPDKPEPVVAEKPGKKVRKLSPALDPGLLPEKPEVIESKPVEPPAEEIPVVQAEEFDEKDDGAYLEAKAVGKDDDSLSFEKRFDLEDDEMPDVDDDEFLKVQRFGDPQVTLKTALIVGAVAVAVVIILFVMNLAQESNEIYQNVQKRNEASEIARQRGLQEIDHVYKYHNALTSCEVGTIAGYRSALEWLDGALANKPEYVPAIVAKAEILALLAIEFEQKEGIEQSCSLAEKALELAPASAPALRAKGACLLADGKTKEADKTILQALTLNEGDTANDAAANYILAHIYLRKKNLDKAIFTLNSVVALSPLNFRAYYLLADAYASQRQWHKAVDSINKALKLIPDHRDARQRLSAYQSQVSGDTREAALVPGMSEELGSQMDKKERGKLLVGKIRQAIRRGSINEALGLINELLKLGTHTGTAYMLKCQLYVNTGSYDAALNTCTNARNYSADAYYYLGAVHEAMGNEALKQRNYQAYLSARPNGSYAGEVRSILGQQ